MRIVDYNMATFRLFNCGKYRGRHHATPAAAAAAAPIMTAPRLPPRAATGGGREMIGTSAPGISASWPLLATMHDLCRHAQRCSGAAGAGSIIYASFLGRDGGCLCFAPPMAAELARKFRHLNLSLHVHVTNHVHQFHTSQICLHHLLQLTLVLGESYGESTSLWLVLPPLTGN